MFLKKNYKKKGRIRMLRFEENKNNVEEFNYLYDAVGWGAYSKEISAQALKNNVYSVSVYDDDKIIGYGRIIGDGIVFLYIHDVMVIPEYQSKKIGTQIMNKLLEKIAEVKKTNPSLRVYLGASLNREGFYEKFGFVTREKYGLGSGMILNNK
jgi:GNAT superfamily N-acetyltransferase